MTTLKAIGAQGYSIGDAIRPLLGEVLDVMDFKKRKTVDLKRRIRTAAFADAVGFLEHPGAYLWIANEGSADTGYFLRLGDAIR